MIVCFNLCLHDFVNILHKQTFPHYRSGCRPSYVILLPRRSQEIHSQPSCVCRSLPKSSKMLCRAFTWILFIYLSLNCTLATRLEGLKPMISISGPSPHTGNPGPSSLTSQSPPGGRPFGTVVGGALPVPQGTLWVPTSGAERPRSTGGAELGSQRVPQETATLPAPEPELGPFDFNTAPCPGMMAEFSRGWARCEARKEADVSEKVVRTQEAANDVLRSQAVCLCTYTYSATKPHVQVFLGRCRSWVPTDAERASISERMKKCTDSDFPGLAIDAGLELRSDGQVSRHGQLSRRVLADSCVRKVFTYYDPTYVEPARNKTSSIAGTRIDGKTSGLERSTRNLPYVFSLLILSLGLVHVF